MVLWFICALFVFLAFKFIPPLKKIEVDGFMSVAFVLVPGIIMIFVNLAIPQGLLTFALGLILSFIVPAGILKNGYNLNWGAASKYALVVVGIVFLVELALGILLEFQG